MTLKTAIASILLATACITTTSAQAAIRHDIDIPAQELGSALIVLAKQARIQVVYSADLVQGHSILGLNGSMTPGEALDQLLAKTGLKYEFLDEQTVTLSNSSGKDGDSPDIEATRGAGGAAGTGEASTATGFWNRLRLAQAEPSSGSSEQRISQDAERNAEIQQIDEVIVTGTNIRGLINNTAPVTTYDREYIDSTGIATATGFMESLPQNLGSIGQDGVLVTGLGNAEQGASVNLRGIGEGATLILLNGRRMAPGFAGSAVDISSLPLSMVERVEVLTEGASAMYGADAVGGVVNFVLRKDFDGAETRLRGGWADAVDELRANQTVGSAWQSGNALLSVEYYERDLLSARDRDFVPNNSLIGSLLPEDENLSALGSMRQELTPALTAFADVLYAARDSYNEGGRTTINQHYNVDNVQIAATAGAEWDIGGGWNLQALGTYAENERELLSRNRSSSTRNFNRFEISDARMDVSGTLGQLPGGPVRSGFGVEWRSETISVINLPTVEQDIRSGFAEIYVPIVGAPNALPGIGRLEVSLAGRYDDYSTFGSSFDPRAGVMWQVRDGLRFRASYGTAFVPPKLTDHILNTNSAAAFFSTDPGFPGGVSYQLQVFGNDTDFRPQSSESGSIGAEWELAPEGPKFGINYFEIDYKDRITPAPASTLILSDSAAYGSLLIRDPTLAQVDQYVALAVSSFVALDANNLPTANFDPSAVDVILDLRRHNRSVSRTRGLDFSASYSFGIGEGRLSLALEGTHLLEVVQQTTSASAAIENVDTFYNPPDLRLRASAGWQRHGWSANVFANYTDAYRDNRLPLVRPMESYTTVDARVAYRFEGGWLEGLTAAISAQNLFDQDPPAAAIVSTIRDLGYDPTNADPMGRLIAIEIVKAW